MTADFIPVKYLLTDSSMLINYTFNLPLCTGPSNVFSSLPFRNMYSFKIWRPWIAVLAILAGVVQWRYKDWNRPQIPWHFTGYSLTLLEFSLAYLNQTNSVPKTIIYTCIFLVSKNAILPRINQIKFSKIFKIFTSQFAALYCETVSNFMTVIPAFSYERPSAVSLSFDIILIIMTDLATA